MMLVRTLLCVLFNMLWITLAGCSGPERAICVIDNAYVKGIIQLYQETESAYVSVNGEIRGLSPGLHGFHVHEFGDLSGGCASAGPHFNPFKKTHGAPEDVNRHVGDLGNLYAGPDGVAKINIVDHQLSLCGTLSVIGRAIVVHAKPDDLGRGGDAESLKTGNAGARVGCCVIGRAKIQ